MFKTASNGNHLFSTCGVVDQYSFMMKCPFFAEKSFVASSRNIALKPSVWELFLCISKPREPRVLQSKPSS